jgi:SOS-response transcriptional repressor LexA
MMAQTGAFKMRGAMTDSALRKARKKAGLSTPLHQLDVLGEVAAGVWLESEATHLQDYEPIPVAEDPRYKGRRQFALKVLGESMNKIIPAGSFVICVAADGRAPQHDDIVVVHRRWRGLFQATLKRYRIVNGRPDLYPESNHPDFQKPLSAEADEGETSEVHAFVIGVYNSLGRK